MRDSGAVLTFLRSRFRIPLAHRRGGRHGVGSAARGGELVAPAVATYTRDWLFELAGPHLGEHVVEVGARAGMMTQCVANRARVVVVEGLPHFAAALRARYGGSPNVEVYQGDGTDAHVWETIRSGGLLDSAMSFDYLEHVENDVAVMRNVHEALRPGGRMVIVTAAFPRLHGSLDTAAGNIRRYRRRELAGKARRAGFRVIDCHFVNAPGFLLWYLGGRLDGPPGGARWARASGLFDRLVVPAARFVERHRHPPFGQNLLLIAEKPGSRP